MAKRQSDEDARNSDGHTLVGGARWHYPKTGSPSECAIPGCDRILTRHLRANVVDGIEADVVDLTSDQDGIEDAPEADESLAAAG